MRSYGHRSYGHSSYRNTNNSTNETNGRARGSTAEEVDPRTRLAEPVVKLLVELGEAVTHVMEIVRVRTREGVAKSVKLKEDVKGPVTLSLCEGIGIRV